MHEYALIKMPRSTTEARDIFSASLRHQELIVISIDKLYTQIGNDNRLHNIIEPFAALFWALGIVFAHILQ